MRSFIEYLREENQPERIKIDPRYLFYALTALHGQGHMNRIKTDGIIPNLRTSHISDIPVGSEGHTLGDIAQIGTNMENAHFWIKRRGGEREIGRPVNEFHREHIGIRVKDEHMG